MVTAYTANYADGLESAKEFMVGAINLMGVMVEHRDEPGAQIPVVFKPNIDHLVQSLNKTHEELTAFMAKSDQEIAREIDRDYEEKKRALAKRIEKAVAANKRIDRLKKAIEDHNFPEDLKDYQEFMISLLELGNNYVPSNNFESKITVEQYRKEQVRLYEQSIKQTEDEITNEIKRAQEKTEWVAKALEVIDEIDESL